MPKFPNKKILKNRKTLTEKRRSQLEYWLQIVLKYPEISQKMLDYFGLSKKTLESEFPSSASPDEKLILDFIDKLSGGQNNKMAQIEKFNWKFFSMNRKVSEEVLKKLLENLIPLGGSDLCGGKVIDILTNLTSIDHFKGFLIVSKIFANIDIGLLKELSLNEYLTKKKFVDSQLQAYNLCKIYEENARESQISELVRIMQLQNDKNALEIFINWGVGEKTRKVLVTESSGDWRQLISEDNFELKFRLLGKELEICAEIVVESTVQRIEDMLTKPEERKEWDIMLVDMKKINNNGIVFTYSSDRTFYEFHTISTVSKSETVTQITFSTTCYEKQQNNSKIGKINSHYEIKDIKNSLNGIESSDGNLINNRVKIIWVSQYCETSFALVRDDLLQETDFLKKSMERFICVAENKAASLESLHKPKNHFIDAFERKRLD